jgi:hypothetical protein
MDWEKHWSVRAQARQALAAALRCWVEGGAWTPELMPTLFAGGAPLTGDAPLITAQV